MQTLGFNFEMKQLSESGVFAGLASTYGNLDRQGDIVMPGAFEDSLARSSSVPLLKAHDHAAPIGDAKLADSPAGLLLEGTLDLNVQAARETYSGLKAGYLRAMSIGYGIPAGGSVYRDDGVRELRRLDLYEVSIVAVPANPEAVVTRVKSIGTIREYEQFLRESGYSKSEAKRLALHGWKGLSTPDEDANAELLSLLRGWNSSR